MVSGSACIQGVLNVKVKVKGHVIRALSWILGMSYSVIDGLVYDLERCYLLLFNRVAYFSILFAVHSHRLATLITQASMSFIASGHDSWLETIASYRRFCSLSAVPSFTGLGPTMSYWLGASCCCIRCQSHGASGLWEWGCCTWRSCVNDLASTSKRRKMASDISSTTVDLV